MCEQVAGDFVLEIASNNIFWKKFHEENSYTINKTSIKPMHFSYTYLPLLKKRTKYIECIFRCFGILIYVFPRYTCLKYMNICVQARGQVHCTMLTLFSVFIQCKSVFCAFFMLLFINNKL